MAKFNSKTFNPEAFGAYIERIPKLNKNELIRSKALRGNSEIRNAFSNQTGTAYAILPMAYLTENLLTMTVKQTLWQIQQLLTKEV